MEKQSTPNGEKITIERVENAMKIVAYHIARHVRQWGESPFTVIFERLESEREMLLSNQQTCDRAIAFLAQSATCESQSDLVDKEAPLP